MSAGDPELLAEQLLGRQVLDASDEVLGHIVDMCAGDEGGDLVVCCYLVGPRWAAGRLSLSNLGTRVLSLLRIPLGARSYEVPWQDMDLSDPERPRVRKQKSALRLA